jgi:aconitate hydratase
MLALTFANPKDYDLIQEDDIFSLDAVNLEPGKQLTLSVTHKDNSKDIIKLNHTFNEQQTGWFKAGSALNLIAGYLKK